MGIDIRRALAGWSWRSWYRRHPPAMAATKASLSLPPARRPAAFMSASGTVRVWNWTESDRLVMSGERGSLAGARRRAAELIVSPTRTPTPTGSAAVSRAAWEAMPSDRFAMPW
jgi:hypothetical protein